jgi:AsmA protein
MQSRWVKVAIVSAALVIVVFGLIPLLINADEFRPQVEAQLSSSLGRKVALGHLSFSLITGSLITENISVSDDPAFAAAPFLEAKSLHLGIELGKFLFHHQVQITDLTVDSPVIHLIHAQNGRWNFSSLGSAAARPESVSQQESIIPSLTVGEVKIKDGSATIFSTPAAGRPFVCTDIELAIQQFSFAKPFPFQLSLKLPGDGAFQLSGTAGPVLQRDASETPFQATLQLKHFDPVAAGVVEPGQGISMVADFSAQLASDGTNLSSAGKIEASRLQLSRTGSPAPQPVNIDYTISDNMDARTGRVSDISILAGSVAAHVNGGYRFAGNAIVLDLHLSAPNLPIDQLEQLLPAFGVVLPSGSKLRGGTLSANLAVTGAASAPVIVGPVELDNTQLSGFDLGSKIQGINPLGGTSGGTQIQKLSAEVNSSSQSTQLSNIYGSVPQIGTATGRGTVSPSGEIDFQLVAKLSGSSVVGTLTNGVTGALGGLFSKGSSHASNSGIPITITGTASNPTIRANVGAILKQDSGGLLGNSSGQKKTSPTGMLKGLFGK